MVKEKKSTAAAAAAAVSQSGPRTQVGLRLEPRRVLHSSRVRMLPSRPGQLLGAARCRAYETLNPGIVSLLICMLQGPF